MLSQEFIDQLRELSYTDKLRVMELLSSEVLDEEASTTDPFGWPVGFFSRTFGALVDAPVVRGEQSPMQEHEVSR